MRLQGGRAMTALLLALAGCASADFTEDDSGKTVTLDQGSGFTVALPRGSGPRPAPEIKGALIRPLQRRVDPASNQEIFPFTAEGTGDAIIRIAPSDPSGPEFVIQVHVVPTGRPAAAPFSGKPPGSY